MKLLKILIPGIGLLILALYFAQPYFSDPVEVVDSTPDSVTVPKAETGPNDGLLSKAKENSMLRGELVAKKGEFSVYIYNASDMSPVPASEVTIVKLKLESKRDDKKWVTSAVDIVPDTEDDRLIFRFEPIKTKKYSISFSTYYKDSKVPKMKWNFSGSLVN